MTDVSLIYERFQDDFDFDQSDVQAQLESYLTYGDRGSLGGKRKKLVKDLILKHYEEKTVDYTPGETVDIPNIGDSDLQSEVETNYLNEAFESRRLSNMSNINVDSSIGKERKGNKMFNLAMTLMREASGKEALDRLRDQVDSYIESGSDRSELRSEIDARIERLK